MAANWKPSIGAYMSVDAASVDSAKATRDVTATVPTTAQLTKGAGTGASAMSNCRRLAFDLVFTVMLIGLLLFGALKLWPADPNVKRQPVQAILISTLLPFCTLVLLSAIERLFTAAGPRKSLKTWLLHLQIDMFWSFVAGFTFALASIGSARLAHHFGFNWGLIDLRFATGRGILALIGSVWLSAIATDFFFYWYHRAAHKVLFLWNLHKLHHMDAQLDVMTLSRDNWLDAVYAALALALPSGIFLKLDGLDPVDIGLLSGTVVTVVRTVISLGHMNVRLQVGKASLFYCSPQVHRIHHSRLPHHFDRNFAFIFPLWDLIFGTYYAPARDEFPPTGVPGEKEIESFWEAEIFTLREWWKMFRAWRCRESSTPEQISEDVR